MLNAYLISMKATELDQLELMQLFDQLRTITEAIEIKIKEMDLSPLEVAMIKHKSFRYVHHAVSTKTN